MFYALWFTIKGVGKSMHDFLPYNIPPCSCDKETLSTVWKANWLTRAMVVGCLM